jgi:hypothetical protein
MLPFFDNVYLCLRRRKNIMIKNTEIKLVGQPILKQLLNLVDSVVFKRLVESKSSDRYYKSFKTWPHFVTMMFGILSRCDSMAETCEGLRAMSGSSII